MGKISDATDVVALLTKNSINRPWILYEAGVAKGKLDKQVFGVVVGVQLDQATKGPFAQFQNSGDDEDSLTKLVLQLVYTAILTVEGVPSDIQPLAGGSALQVAIQNNHPEKAAIPCPTTGAGAILACTPGNVGYIAGQGFISIAAGTSNTILPVTLLAPTDAFTPAVLSITAPGGYTNPTSLTTMRVTVQ